MLEGIIMEFALAQEVYLKHDEASDNFYLFCTKSGNYYSLNRISYEILTLLQEGKNKAKIIKWISENYNISIKNSKEDIDELFNILLVKSLIIRKG